MRFPPAPPTFVKRYEFVGKMIGKAGESDLLDMVVDVDQLGRSAVRGYVVGNNTTAEALSRVVESATGGVRLVSANPEDGGLRFRCDGVQVSGVSRRGLGQVDGGPCRVICEFRCPTLCLDHDCDVVERTASGEIHFRLRGQLPQINGLHTAGYRFDGSVETKTEGSELAFPTGFPWRVQLKPAYIHDKLPDRVAISKYLWMLVLQPTGDGSAPPTSEQRERASAVVQDLLLLASYSAKRWITWFNCSYATADGHTEELRETRRVIDEEVWAEDGPIAVGSAQQFLVRGVPRLQDLRKTGLDLSIPLSMAVSSHERSYVEQEFSTLFAVLEKLKDQFAKSNGLDNIMTLKKFSKLRQKLSAEIDRQVAEGTVETTNVEALKEKLAELNRPSIGTVLDAMLAANEVNWRDLYPDDPNMRRPPFIGIRNTLFHTADHVSINRIWMESQRVRAVLDRLFLRLLGWHDLSHVLGPIESELRESLGD